MKAPIRSEIVSSLLINVAFGLLIAVALTFVQHPLAYFYSKREVSGAVLSQAQMTSRMEANDLSDEDPVARFLTTRIGHVLFARQDNDFCQRALFETEAACFKKQVKFNVFEILKRPLVPCVWMLCKRLSRHEIETQSVARVCHRSRCADR